MTLIKKVPSAKPVPVVKSKAVAEVNETVGAVVTAPVLATISTLGIETKAVPF